MVSTGPADLGDLAAFTAHPAAWTRLALQEIRGCLTKLQCTSRSHHHLKSSLPSQKSFCAAFCSEECATDYRPEDSTIYVVHVSVSNERFIQMDSCIDALLYQFMHIVQ